MTREELIKENEELKEFRRNIVAFHQYDMFRAFGNPMVYPPGRDGNKHPYFKGGMELKILENILNGKKPYQDTQREDVLKKDLVATNGSIELYKDHPKWKKAHTENIKFRDLLLKKLDALDFDVMHPRN